MPTRSLILTALLSTLVCSVIGIAAVESWRTRSVEAALMYDTYSIASSTRFISGSTPYLSRSFAAGSRTTWTWSAWVKVGTLGTTRYLFTANGTQSGTDTWFGVNFNTSDQISVTSWSTEFRRTLDVFRDPARWYHVVVMLDTGNGTANNRVRIYVDGIEQKYSVISNPSASATLGVNQSGVTHYLSTYNASSNPFDGYMADVNFSDGYALMPSSFGSFDYAGVWRPIPFRGPFGTNGFRLLFGNGSSLGTDSSGLGNNFTTSGLAATDQVADTPTKNYAVLHPIYYYAASYTDGTVQEGGLAANGNYGAASGWQLSSGKWYWEYVIGGTSSGYPIVGVFRTITYPSGSTGAYPGHTSDSGIGYQPGGVVALEGASGATLSTFTNGDVIGVAYDASNGNVYFSKNGTWQNSAVPASGTGSVGSVLNGYPGLASYYGKTNVNFGQGGVSSLTYYAAAGGYFRYAPPTGFLALSTTNLPAAAVDNPRAYFDARVYFGTSTSQTIGGFAFAPDFVWLKATSTNADHGLFDRVRAAGNVLISSRTNAEAASSSAFSAFTSEGFTLGAFGAFNNPTTASTSPAAPSPDHVAWVWKESPTSGFDIVTYTGNNTANRTIAHSLGAAPDYVIVKRRDSTGDWYVWSSAMGSSSAFVTLNSSTASSTTNSPWCVTCASTNWNSSTFMVTNNGTNNLNVNAATYVAYLFSKKSGYSDVGVYRGNGSADGPFVYTGFRPRYILIKRGDSAASWRVFDSARDPVNPNTFGLTTDLNIPAFAELSLDFLANGFKIRGANNGVNTSAGNYMYLAFADIPYMLAGAPSPYTNTTITRNTNFKKALYVAGAVAKGSGTFVIDHPLDPKNMLLYHSFVESPDMKNVYDGVATLDDNGEATIPLPEYFLKLNSDYRYLTTPIGAPMPELHIQKEAGKRYFFGLLGGPVIKVAGGAPGGKVSWQVTGIRQDLIAKKNPVVVEVDKDQTDFSKKGEYLHPEAYGQ